VARGSSLRRRVLGRTALAVGGLLLLPYAFGPVYSFPEPAAFAGPLLRNPYAATTESWQRANLHAHGSAWGGMTSGTQPATAVVARYRELGYSVPGVSNYHHIAAHDGVRTLPLYEHGINLGKYHQLAIGARAVEWFDFPLWQSLSHRQYVIDRVKRKAALVSLNHPDSRDAYGNEALRYLTGYDMIEVANGPFTTESLWDEALSSGHLVWAVANDDTHDLTDPRRMAVGWNMVDARSAADADIIDALRAGRFYAVLRTGALESANLTRLDRLDVHGDTMMVTLAGAPATITFVGQDGAIRQAVDRTTTAGYTLTPDDTYVRVVVHAPQTVLFLNPVIRWDGHTLPGRAAHVDAAATWTFRGGLTAGAALLVARIRRRRTGTLGELAKS
jgi:hypothetical protein